MTATIGIAFTDTTDKTESDVDAIDATGQALQNAINIINKLPDYRLHISNDISGPDEKARYTAAMQTLERKQQEAQHVLQTAQRQLGQHVLMLL